MTATILTFPTEKRLAAVAKQREDREALAAFKKRQQEIADGYRTISKARPGGRA